MREEKKRRISRIKIEKVEKEKKGAKEKKCVNRCHLPFVFDGTIYFFIFN